MRNRIQVALFLAILLLCYVFLKGHVSPNIFQWVSSLVSLFAVFIGFFIFFENRDPSRTLAWLVVLAIFPIVGFLFYLLFGQSYHKKRKFHRKSFDDAVAEHRLNRAEIQPNILENFSSQQYEKVLRLSSKMGSNSISMYTQSKILTDGEETFSAILAALKKAKHHIHLAYYIVRNDYLGNQIKNLLIKKARQGIQVRFLYDAVGCFDLKKKYIEELRENGVQILPFAPVHIAFMDSQINYRNHRKIVVVDGQIGFMGGLNIGDEYLGKVSHFGYWRDTHMMLDGLAVRNLQSIFLRDWIFTSKEEVREEKQYFQIEKRETDGLVQIIAGGPDTNHKEIKNIFLSMIASARKSIYIASPYFIPDEDVCSAIRIASLGGVDVRILFPYHPDKKFVFYASRSYFVGLLEDGVQIYQYLNGFMHSKFIIVDGQIASIGTANMDMRSFHLNFEINCFMYFSDSVLQLEKQFFRDLENSQLLCREAFKNRPMKERVCESFCRLFSPLL